MNNLPSRRTRGRRNYKSTNIDVDAVQERLETVTKKKWKHFILGYFVSEDGQVYNEYTKHLESPINLESGYKQYTIFYNGKRVNFLLHRLVGYCFDDDVTPEMLLNKDEYKAHHCDTNKLNNHYTNICYLLNDIHKEIHSDIGSGTLKKETVNTRNKLKRYVKRHYNNSDYIINDMDFRIDDNVLIDKSEIFPDAEYKIYCDWCMDNGYNERYLSSAIIYAVYTDGNKASK